MISIFKKIFGKSEPKVAVPAPVVATPTPSAPMPTIEVAHLSLAAIVARFPDELKPLLLNEPDAAATVALPMPTILKQLPAGSVKMSLASLHRQAHGLIRPLPPGDKRSVDVPLAEVFRHVRPEALRRRPDQRQVDVPNNGFNLFGDSTNPYAISPDDHMQEVSLGAPSFGEEEAAPVEAPVGAPRVLKMDEGLQNHFGNGSTASSGSVASEEESAQEEAPESPQDTMPRAIAPPADFNLAAPAPTRTPTPFPFVPAPKPVAAPAPVAAPVEEAPVTKPTGPTLLVPLFGLSPNWPEALRAEIEALDRATQVTLPMNEISAGLAKGRVSFAWKQIFAWLDPEPAAGTAIPGDTALQLPLKVVAPAFLAATKKPETERKTIAMDESIPSLFTDGRPAPELTPAEPVETAEEPVAESATDAPEASEAPAVHAEPPAEPAPSRTPESVGELFGEPHKTNWTPAELVAGIVKLPGVSGAIVALQEGLPVAASLPEGVKGEVVAAFLPQIFARLNQYAGEMRLGDVDDLLFTTHGAHCQIYRLGYIYFAVLGIAGEALPWHELQLVTQELARQTHK